MTAFVVAIALCYVLVKIPFWILGSIKISQGRSVLGSMAKAFLAYKTAGLVGAGAKKAIGAFSSRRVPPMQGRGWTRNDPYDHASWDSDGHGVLPLAGVGPSSWGPGARQARAAGSTPSGAERAGSGSRYAHPRRGQGRQTAWLTQQGTAKALPPDRRRPPHPGVPRQARPGEQTMLPVFAGHEPDRQPRETVHEEQSQPRPGPPRPPESEQPALFTADGRIRSHARPPKPEPGDVPGSRPGQQQALNMPLRLTPEQAQRRARHLARPPAAEPETPKPAATSSWPRVKGQQPLLRPDGSVHPRARAHISTQARQRTRHQARDQHHRRTHSAPPAPEFQSPPPPPATTRQGRTAPPPTARTEARTHAPRPRSTRLNTPRPASTRTHRPKGNDYE